MTSIAIAGSMELTAQVADFFWQQPEVEVPWVLTNAPRPAGRGLRLTPTPVETWARGHNLPVYYPLATKPALPSREAIGLPIQAPDILFVFGFGHLVPKWLLDYPTIAPLNLHPSALPKWRGSAPGQYVILYGEHESAVSTIIMNEKFDEGKVIDQLPFSVDPTWTATDYYQHAINLWLQSKPLPRLLEATKTSTNIDDQNLANGKVSPGHSGMFLKGDGYLPWEIYQLASDIKSQNDPAALRQHPHYNELSPVIKKLLAAQPLSAATLLNRMRRALSPWPGVWTINPSSERQKIS